MRYYDLSLFGSQGRLLTLSDLGFSFGNPKLQSAFSASTFSSRIKGPNGLINNPGALNLEMDIPIAAYDLPQGGAYLRISGIGLKAIAQSANLNLDPSTGAPPTKFVLSGGLMRGLPLANDYAARNLGGVLAQGIVFQSFGNWQGAEQSLDLLVLPADTNPANGISFIWSPHETLAESITDSLTVAFPDLKPVVTILPGLMQTQSSQDLVGWYENLSQFASYIFDLTQPMGAALTGKKTYPGVMIGFRGTTIYATDGTQNSASDTVQLEFRDLVGQPTWLGANQISFKTVLRADIQLGDFVAMPRDPGTTGTNIISSLALTQQAAAFPGAPARNSSSFKGTFYVTEVHHFGNLRQPDADSWATAFVANVVEGSAGGFNSLTSGTGPTQIPLGG